MGDFAFLQYPGVIAVAHRGGMAEAAENSVEAFARTVALGYRYIETDVRAVADGKLYTWHGPSDRERDESALDLDSLPAKTRKSLPLLADVLRDFPKTRLQIDPKHWLAVEPLADAIIDARAVDRVSIGSFSDERIAAVAQRIYDKTGKRVAMAMGPHGLMRLFARGILAPGRAWSSPWPSALPPMRYATKRLIRAAHSGQMKVIPWTVNERADMIRLLDDGADGIITDFPSRLREVLLERGQWHEA